MPSYGGSQTTGTILGKSRRKSKPPGNQYQGGKGKPKSRLRSRPPQKNVVDHIKQQNAKEDAERKAKEDAESLKRHRRWTKEQERKERKEREAAKKEQERLEERLEAAKRARAKKLAKKNRTNVEAVGRRRRVQSRSVSPVRDRSDLRAVVGRTGGNKRNRPASESSRQYNPEKRHEPPPKQLGKRGGMYGTRRGMSETEFERLTKGKSMTTAEARELQDASYVPEKERNGKQFPTLNGGGDQCRQRLVDCLRPVAASLLQARLLGAHLLRARLVNPVRHPLLRNFKR